MDANRASEKMYQVLQSLISGESIDFKSELAKVLDEEFQNAEKYVTMRNGEDVSSENIEATNIDITTPAGTLTIPFLDFGSIDNLYILVDAIIEYWKNTVELTGTPVPCEEEEDPNNIKIISVENDAEKIRDPLVNDILSLADGKTHNPPYYDFFNIIFEHVRTIEWTIIERQTDDTAQENQDDSTNTEPCEEEFKAQVK